MQNKGGASQRSEPTIAAVPVATPSLVASIAPLHDRSGGHAITARIPAEISIALGDHRDPPPADSFPEGFRTTAPAPHRTSSMGRRPKPSTIAEHSGSAEEIGRAWSTDHVRFRQKEAYEGRGIGRVLTDA